VADAAPDRYGAAKANLRDTVKWLAAALAGAAGIAVGASPLTALGSLSLHSPRLHAALAALAIAVAALILGAAIVFYLLLTDVFVLEDVLNHGWLIAFVDQRHKDLLPPDYRSLRAVLSEREAASATMFTNRGNRASAEYIAAQNRYESVKPLLTGLTPLLHLEVFRRRVQRASWALLVCALVGGAGLTCFAWAANPPHPPGAGH
jgi:hypothetical protein